MEVSQAILKLMFFSDALLMSKFRGEEVVNESYQMLAFVIILAATFAEYLFIMALMIKLAYDFFKNRKMMKKMNVQRRTYEFLRFDESHRDVGNRWHNSALGIDPGSPKRKDIRQNRIAEPPRLIVEARRRNVQERKDLDNPSTNNPQLLKFDGESAPPQEDRARGPHLDFRRVHKIIQKKKEKGISLSKENK